MVGRLGLIVMYIKVVNLLPSYALTARTYNRSGISLLITQERYISSLLKDRIPEVGVKYAA
jgi:hypothetical protein